MDFAIGLVSFVLVTCPTDKWSFFRNSNYRRTVKSVLLMKSFFKLVEMTLALNFFGAVVILLLPFTFDWSWIRRPNLAIYSELKQQRRRWLPKRHIIKREFDLLQTLSYLFQPNSFNSSNVGKLDCIEVEEKKKKVVVLCWRSPQSVNLGRILTSQSCTDSKEMYKKAWCTCKVLFSNLSLLALLFFRFRCC